MANSTIIAQADATRRPTSLNSTTITSEDDLRLLPTGVYQVAGSTGGILPISYGVFVMFRTGGAYQLALAVDSNNGRTYVRTANSTAWQYAWVQL